MPRITIVEQNEPITVKQAFDEFIEDRIGSGVSDATIKAYHSHMAGIAKRVNIDVRVSAINQSFVNRLIAKMRGEQLALKTVESYVRTLCVFINYCREMGYTDAKIKMYHAPETVQETYTDDELAALLAKPSLSHCDFATYRTWVIINMLINNGPRSATIRGILIKDINFENHWIQTRHNKGKIVQVLPMTPAFEAILKEYLEHRKGGEEDYLFCDSYGNELTADALKHSVIRYNHRRGVRKTSIHAFRHTFAKKYLLDCGGNAFSLQKLLGHKTLDMTRHYCNLYDAEIARNYDKASPLSQMQKKISMGRGSVPAMPRKRG